MTSKGLENESWAVRVRSRNRGQLSCTGFDWSRETVVGTKLVKEETKDRVTSRSGPWVTTGSSLVIFSNN